MLRLLGVVNVQVRPDRFRKLVVLQPGLSAGNSFLMRR